MNFGVIASCIALSTPLNCLLSSIFYNEKLSLKMIFGTTIIFIGIVWVAMAKGQVYTQDSGKLSEEDRDYYKMLSIGLAVGLGVLNSLRTCHGKYVNTRLKYPPIDFSIDQGLFCGLFCLIFSTYYFFIGTESYTFYNLSVNFVASTMRMTCAIVSLNCMVKGLAGPTSAIIQTNSIV
jgi:drug/metabolite transporter (DMT)-like permease